MVALGRIWNVRSGRFSRPLKPAQGLFFAIAITLSGIAMASTSTDSLLGTWKLDGAFSSSGETMTAVISESPDHKIEITLPKDLQPSGSQEKAVLHASGSNIYVGQIGADTKVRVTVSAPGKADLSLNTDNSKGFARFGYGMTLVTH